MLALGACTTARDAPPANTVGIAPLSAKYSAIVIEAGTGKTLYQSAANETRYPASLTKMMTLYMLFEAIQSGRVSMSSAIPVSDYARSRPPSKLGFKAGETLPMETAIQALAVKSANDVAAAVAEYLGGSEAQFAAMMTAKARQLGMGGTSFENASGLPDDGQRTTARDMVVLGMALKTRFPQFYPYFSQQQFVFRGKVVKGHNDLIASVAGVDGIKTGYIRASGYNIVTSVSRGGRRLFIVVMGGESGRSRNDHVRLLIDRFLPDRSVGSSTGADIGAMLWAQ